MKKKKTKKPERNKYETALNKMRSLRRLESRINNLFEKWESELAADSMMVSMAKTAVGLVTYYEIKSIDEETHRIDDKEVQDAEKI